MRAEIPLAILATASMTAGAEAHVEQTPALNTQSILREGIDNNGQLVFFYNPPTTGDRTEQPQPAEKEELQSNEELMLFAGLVLLVGAAGLEIRRRAHL